jgi:hypothetical protein
MIKNTKQLHHLVLNGEAEVKVLNREYLDGPINDMGNHETIIIKDLEVTFQGSTKMYRDIWQTGAWQIGGNLGQARPLELIQD